MSSSLKLVWMVVSMLLCATHVAGAEPPQQTMGAGYLHTLWVKADGTLWAWGDNEYGQLGDGTTTDKLLPVQVGNDNSWVAISAGYWHSLGLKSDGSLWGWGGNMYGQLGDGTTGNRPSPVRIGNANDWVFISAGYGHTLALKSDGSLWAWGWNSFGVLGDGSGSDRLVPVQIAADKRWAIVSAGGFHNLGMTADGRIWSWGRNDFGQLGDGTLVNKNLPIPVGSNNKWSFISAGAFHSTAINANGTLWAWGDNTYGQLGDGTTTGRSSPVQIGSDTDWVAVPGGGYYTLGLKANGTIWAWGNNNFGQLGDGTFTDRISPTQVETDTRWVAIAAHDHNLALKSDGTLWAWGANRSGEIGNGQLGSRRSPVQIGLNGDGAWLTVTGGIYYSLGVTSDGKLWGWGYNGFGQLGNGTKTDTPLPVQIGAHQDWVAISGGYVHALGIRADGTLWGWGDNGWGQVGNGTTGDQLSPVQIGSDRTWVAVSASALYFSLGIKSDGTLWAWGDNRWGQLGDGTTTGKLSPVQIGSARDWVAVAAGGAHSVALKADGTLWAWGDNGNGQVGDGTGLMRTSPVRVGTANDWRLISTGYVHTVARKSDGTLWVWGSNHQGELGLGDFTDRLTPVQVGSDRDWAAFVGKNDTSHAVKAHGALWGWGDSTFGQLGDGTNIRKLSPVRIGADNDWVTVERAFYHSLGLKADGSLWAWGRNQYGQLGDGTTIDRNAPIRVAIAASTSLTVTPATGFVSSGSQGGPFSPVNKTYTLTNTSGSSINWTASKGQSWTSLSSTSGTLAAGASTTVTVSIQSTANNLTSGSYGDTVTFTNTTDGSGSTERSVTLTVVEQRSDLIVATLTAPTAMVTPGQVIDLMERTTNQGTGGTPGATVTRFYWSTNSTHDGSDLALGQRTVEALAAGASSGPVETPVTIPSTATPGTYYLIARADADATATETSETNNTRYTTVRIGVDLRVSALVGPTVPVAPGQTINLSETTWNQGTIATSGATVTRFYWSTNSIYEAADLPLGQRPVGVLAAGASSGPVTTSVTIPSTATAGSFYIIARADADTTQTETSETNNTRFITVGLGADLMVPTLTTPTPTVAPGQVVKLTDTTRNQGTAATLGTTVTRFYWSTNSTFDGSDLSVGQRTVNPLAAGASSGPVETSVTIPPTATSGTYYLIARADADTTETETSETNNTRYTTVRIGVDLIIATLTGPSVPVAPGQTINLSETTRNQATVTTSGTTVTRFYWSTNSTYEAADLPLGQRPVGVLAAGASSGPVTTSVTIPSTATAGSYYIIARADADGSETETSETNNTRSATVGIGADLMVSTLTSLTPTVAPGQVITLRDTTRNQGTAAAGATTVTRFYWSTNSTYEASDVAVGQRTVGPLAAGGTSGPVDTPVTIPPTATVGTYYLIARADADAVQTETSEINNTRSTTVMIGVDLIVSALTGATPRVTPGQAITLSETTTNQGTVAAASNTVTRFYWSTNSSYDAADLQLGQRMVGPLAAGASSGAANTPISVPSSATAGQYYIIARSDADNSEMETLETNNTKYISVRID